MSVYDVTGEGYFARVENDTPVYISYTEEKFQIPTKESLKHYNSWYYRYDDAFVYLQSRGTSLVIKRYQPEAASDTLASSALTAPMPGKIIAVNAKTGDAVKAGDPLIIMEAMKMEMTLEAPRDGVVAEVTAAIDALVTDGEMLLSLEEENE